MTGVQFEPSDRKNHHQVIFYARDPYNPEATQTELNWFMQRFHDVWDWHLLPDGRVVVQYDPSGISDELIEEVLIQHGFEVKHIADVTNGTTQ